MTAMIVAIIFSSPGIGALRDGENIRGRLSRDLNLAATMPRMPYP